MYSAQENSVVRLSANGVIVVDGQRAEDYKALNSRIRRVSELPVKLLITTDHHLERPGVNANFRAMGAEVLAHQNVATNLAARRHSRASSRRPESTSEISW
jgi:hypothetical protein